MVFSVCDRTIITHTKSKHSIFKTHIHKEEYGIVVKDPEIIKPAINEKDF